jgi:hypothetical protein
MLILSSFELVFDLFDESSKSVSFSFNSSASEIYQN